MREERRSGRFFHAGLTVPRDLETLYALEAETELMYVAGGRPQGGRDPECRNVIKNVSVSLSQAEALKSSAR
jgi:hypothetical protein